MVYLARSPSSLSSLVCLPPLAPSGHPYRVARDGFVKYTNDPNILCSEPSGDSPSFPQSPGQSDQPLHLSAPFSPSPYLLYELHASHSPFLVLNTPRPQSLPCLCTCSLLLEAISWLFLSLRTGLTLPPPQGPPVTYLISFSAPSPCLFLSLYSAYFAVTYLLVCCSFSISATKC